MNKKDKIIEIIDGMVIGIPVHNVEGIADQILALDDWVSEKEEKPDFDILVLVQCLIYGRYVTIYTRINDTNHGQWVDPDGNAGGLPPIYWQPLPEPKQ